MATIPKQIQDDLQAIFDAKESAVAATAALPALTDAVTEAQRAAQAGTADVNGKVQAVIDAKSKFEADLAGALAPTPPLPSGASA